MTYKAKPERSPTTEQMTERIRETEKERTESNQIDFVCKPQLREEKKQKFCKIVMNRQNLNLEISLEIDDGRIYWVV